MNRRRRQIETSTPHKVQVINVIPCDDRKIIEGCVKKRLENYIVRKRKDYIHCSYNDIINEINKIENHSLANPNLFLVNVKVKI